MISAADFLNEAERKHVANAIGEAEALTSGEIRVHLEDHIEEDVVQHAVYVFEQIGMQRTQERNGVLIYVSVADRLVAVIGDKGINERVPPGYWDTAVSILKERFAKGEQADGLCEVVHSVASLLSKHFPFQERDPNELSNDVSIGGE